MARARRRPAPRFVAPTPNPAMSARKSAPVSAGGVNVRRLMLSREAAMEHKHEDEAFEADEPSNECGNPFCRQLLANRYARYCELKPMCQRYRALKLQKKKGESPASGTRILDLSEEKSSTLKEDN
ncbi:hypothetical protein PInf_020269 [Phytophthora infestans]|nr:hypothetical protein PInf_020269 [Phytophthora infestans]